MPDELFARLRAHYAEPQPVGPAAAAALGNSRARFSRVVRVEPTGGTANLPPGDAPGGTTQLA